MGAFFKTVKLATEQIEAYITAVYSLNVLIFDLFDII